MNTNNLFSHRKSLFYIILLAVVLRLLFIASLDTTAGFAGGDSNWYLQTGLALVTSTLDYPIQPGPTFLVYNGLIQLIFPQRVSAEIILRLLNIGWQIILLVAVYILGARYVNSGVGLLAALVVAINPIFIIESGAILTESMFVGLLFGTLAIYTVQQDNPSLRLVALIGLLLGLTALTRAVLLLFPLILVVHLVRLHNWQRGLRFSAVLLLAYALTVSTWTVYNLVRWNRFLIAAEGFTAFAWMGATGITDAQQVDEAIGVKPHENRDAPFLQGLGEALTQKLPDYIKQRLSNLSEAYIQPHNTPFFPGESLKVLAVNWLTSDRSISGLIRLTQGDAFWPKLTLYIFHIWALGFGLAGMLLLWRRFWVMLPIYGFILYLTAVHSILFALPRYLFPTEPVLIFFAATSTVALFLAIRNRQFQQTNTPHLVKSLSSSER